MQKYLAALTMKMHIHSGDQVLFVTAGKGIIATEARQEVISVGDVVHILRISLAFGTNERVCFNKLS